MTFLFVFVLSEIRNGMVMLGQQGLSWIHGAHQRNYLILKSFTGTIHLLHMLASLLMKLVEGSHNGMRLLLPMRNGKRRTKERSDQGLILFASFLQVLLISFITWAAVVEWLCWGGANRVDELISWFDCFVLLLLNCWIHVVWLVELLPLLMIMKLLWWIWLFSCLLLKLKLM